MSWTKIIKCDICGKQHEFWKEVSRERGFIQIHLNWSLILVGRHKYDVCPECKGNASKEDLEKYFKENPGNRIEPFSETMDKLRVKGFNRK